MDVHLLVESDIKDELETLIFHVTMCLQILIMPEGLNVKFVDTVILSCALYRTVSYVNSISFLLFS